MTPGVEQEVWGPRALGVAELERELSRLRHGQGAQTPEGAHSVARASVLNLVIFATREVHARRAAEAVADLALRHPSRAIVVLADRRRDEGIAPDLALRGRVPRGEGVAQVSCEQILIRARGDSDERIASAVIPLLLPDLPVFLWWTGTPPLDRAPFDDLVALADRVIVDSGDFARPDRTLAAIWTTCYGGRGGGFSVADFNWTRLTPWREFVTQFFDVPAWRPFLDGITGVRVGFAVDADGRAIHTSQALLLLGWLASRLGWRSRGSLAPSEAGGLLFAMSRADGAGVRIRIRPRFERGMSEGDLSGVRIQAAAGGHDAEFVAKRTPDARQATATVLIDGHRRAARTSPLPSPAVDELLGEELTIVASDAVYEDALAALVALA